MLVEHGTTLAPLRGSYASRPCGQLFGANRFRYPLAFASLRYIHGFSMMSFADAPYLACNTPDKIRRHCTLNPQNDGTSCGVAGAVRNAAHKKRALVRIVIVASPAHLRLSILYNAKISAPRGALYIATSAGYNGFACDADQRSTWLHV